MATKKTPPIIAPDAPVSQTASFNSRTMSAGNIRTSEYPPVKTSGIKMRGGGAATKGTTCRGPMA